MAKAYRQGRMGEEIKKTISQLLLREIKDPALQDRLLSISAVEVTNDSSYATIYISAFGAGKDTGSEEKEEILAGFRRAKGLIKREIGRQMSIRHVPELIFKIDSSMEYGAHMSELIDSLGIENYKAQDSVPQKDTEKELDEILKDL